MGPSGGARGLVKPRAVVPIDGSSRRVADGSLLRLITRVGDGLDEGHGTKMQSRLWRDQHRLLFAQGLEDSSRARGGPQDLGEEEVVLVRRPKRDPR